MVTRPQFRQKKITATNYIDDSICQVTGVQYSIKTYGAEKGLKRIFCCGCKGTCFLYCYGLNTLVYEEMMKGYMLYYFVCDSCQSNARHEPCVVCGDNYGLKKQLLNSSKFVHVNCGLLSPQIEIVSFITMEFRELKEVQSVKLRCDRDSCNYSSTPYELIKQIAANGGYKDVPEPNPNIVFLIDYDKIISDFKKQKQVDRKTYLLKGVHQYLSEINEKYHHSLGVQD